MRRLNEEHTWDIAIVGSGPAGIATCLSLIQLDPGWSDRIIVLEKTTHPRYKLCGGGITPFGLAQLRRLNLKLEVPFVHAETAAFKYRGRVVSVRGEPAVAVTRRDEFDAWLVGKAREAGVRIAEDCPVQGLERTRDGVLLQTPEGPVRARTVVGADGSRGIVRRFVRARESPPRVARLLEVVTPATGDEPEFRSRVATFDFSRVCEDLQGYEWDFPSVIDGEPHLNRGIYDSRVAVRRRRARLPGLLSRKLSRSGEAAASAAFEGHPIRRFSPRNRFSSPRTILVGDAAGAEPLFGEGISVALGYGEVAAQALADGFDRLDFSFSDYRRRLLPSPVGRYLLLRWYVAWWTYRLSGRDVFMRGLWRLARSLNQRFGPLPTVPGVVPAPPSD